MQEESAMVLSQTDPETAPCLPLQPKRPTPLSMVRPGEKVRVSSVSGRDEAKHFLCNLGFVEDAEVAVLSEMNGNVIVNIKGTRMAISKAMASRVLTA